MAGRFWPHIIDIGVKATLTIEHLGHMNFEWHQSGALHEAGHAVTAAIFGREIIEISIVEDESGGGYVHREQRESTPHEVMEEILIALAGEEAPYLWSNWPTNAEHDEERIEDLLAKNMLPQTLDFKVVRGELKAMLEKSREAIGAVAHEVWKQKVMSGDDALDIIRPHLPDLTAIPNTIDAIIRTQSEMSVILERFPHLHQCWQEAGTPVLENTYIGKLLALLRDELVEFGLVGIEAALASLLHRFKPADLSEQVRDLFAEGNRSESRWEKSWTELTALAHIHDRGLLRSLGWPATDCDTPPFDCLMSIADQLIPCDIKSAIGNAFSQVSDALDTVIQRWAAENGIENPPFALRYRGTLAQEVVGPALRKAVRDFGTELGSMKSIPSKSLKLKIGGVRFEVFIGPSARDTSSGGIQGSEALATCLRSTYSSHVVQKAKTAEEKNRCPFILMYVQTSGSGMSDLRTASVFKEAIARLSSTARSLAHSAGDLWLGSILLDRRQSVERVVCCLRASASWPNGVLPEIIAQRLGGELVTL